MRALFVAASLVGAGTALAAPPPQWPGFRGAGQGLSPERGLPERWSATENVAWRAAVPGAGWSSPIVAGKRVGAVCGEGGVAALSVDGRVLWTKTDHPFCSLHGLGASPSSSRASSSSRGTAAADGDDKTLGWQKPWDRSHFSPSTLARGGPGTRPGAASRESPT